MSKATSSRSHHLSLRGAGALLLIASSLLLPGTAQANGIDLGPSICRGAGFWSTHAGTEKQGVNIVGALLEEMEGCLDVCGEVITNTAVDDAESAEEALCISPKAQLQIQLVRQLTAAALNCIISTGQPGCDPQWETCNVACMIGDLEQIPFCRAYFDCENNGGTWDSSAQTCYTGTCEVGGAPCGPYAGCGVDNSCVPSYGCDDAELINVDLGLDFTQVETDASSSKKCNQAAKSRCTVVGPNETECDDGLQSDLPESCTCDGVFCSFACSTEDRCEAACDSADECDPAQACASEEACNTACQSGTFGTVCDSTCLDCTLACWAQEDCLAQCAAVPDCDETVVCDEYESCHAYCDSGGFGTTCEAKAECCTQHDTQGCSDVSCEQKVCESDFTCCTEAWSDSCVTSAELLCGELCGESGSSCCVAHDSTGCDDPDCQASICGSDEYCCDTEWDALCTADALDSCTVCGGTPPPPPPSNPCCETHGTAGCDDSTCQETVCASDSWCCSVSWDNQCMVEAWTWCSSLCGPQGSDCCIIGEDPGCSDSTCQDAVCAGDSTCCDSLWDSDCAVEAVTQDCVALCNPS